MTALFHPSLISIKDGHLTTGREVAEKIAAGLAAQLEDAPTCVQDDGFDPLGLALIGGEHREVCFRWAFNAGKHRKGGAIILDLVAAYSEDFGGFFGYVALKPILDGRVTTLYAKPWWQGQIGRMPADTFTVAGLVDFAAQAFRQAVGGMLPQLNDALRGVHSVAWRDGKQLHARPHVEPMDVADFAAMLTGRVRRPDAA